MYLEKIRQIVFEHSGIEQEEIKPASHFAEDLNIGELEFLDIVREIEEEYKIDLEEYIEDIETVEDLINSLTEELD
jgi:acyl carrier protein